MVQGGPVIEKFSYLFPRVKPSFTGPPSRTFRTTSRTESNTF
jgi:hypothetical protein